MDIAILGDRSRSMKKYHRNKLTELVNRMLDEWGVSPEGNHYSLITFDRYSTIHNYFKDSRYQNKRNLRSEATENLKKVPKGWGTRSDIALYKAATELFTKEGGDRPDAKNMLLMFTDGKPKIGRRDKKRFIPFARSTEALEVSQLQFNFVMLLVETHYSILGIIT